MAALEVKQEKNKASESVDTYCRVSNALANLTSKGIKLGHIPRSVYLQYESDDEENESGDERRKSDKDIRIQKKPEDVILQRLMRESVAPPYFVSEEWSSDDDQRVYIDGTSVHDVGKLLELCKPSGYGDLKTNTTKVDDRVRKSWECTEGLSFDSSKAWDEFRHRVSIELYNGRKIKFEINKLNVYPVGGFFSKHQDTPKPGVVGSVVLALPFAFTGGHLIIRSPFQSQSKKDAEVKLFTDHDGKSVHAVAFYGNCEHEVTKVQSGTRVTLTFYIKYDETKPQSKPAPASDSDSDSDSEKERATVKNKDAPKTNSPAKEPIEKQRPADKNDAGGEKNSSFQDEEKDKSKVDLILDYFTTSQRRDLGVMCRNRYSLEELRLRRLKGTDADLIDVLSSCKTVDWTLVPVVVNETFSDPAKRKYCVYRFDESDILKLQYDKSAVRGNGVATDGKTEFVGFPGRTLREENTPYIAYTGNEAQPRSRDNHYYSAAIIIGLLPTKKHAVPSTSLASPSSSKRTKR